MYAYWLVTFALLVASGTHAELLTDLRREHGLEGGLRRAPSLTWMSRDRRTFRVPPAPHRVIDPVSDPSDCFLVYADEGELFYKASSDEGPICGIYLIAPQDKKIEVVFTYLDVPCDDGGIVAWVDGWELSGEVWPAGEAWGEERVVEVCGRRRRPRRLLLSQQNAALLQYRVPARARGFSVRVRHVHNARPCNVMLYGERGVHTVRNYGAARNCSVVSVGPASVHVLALDVGVTNNSNTIEMETGAVHQCIKRGIVDHADIGGSSSLDHTNMEILDSLCGLNFNEELRPALIGCANTVVRLISSGRYRNSVTVSFQPLDVEDLLRADLLCEI